MNDLNGEKQPGRVGFVTEGSGITAEPSLWAPNRNQPGAFYDLEADAEQIMMDSWLFMKSQRRRPN